MKFGIQENNMAAELGAQEHGWGEGDKMANRNNGRVPRRRQEMAVKLATI
jgi:hypothetical protein